RKIVLSFESPIPEWVMDVDELKLQQIISNLLANAIKFTEENGRITLAVDQGELAGQPALEIEVRDSGVGISEEELPHIFDRFYQADNSPSRRGEGTGIGLALVKELTELMQGYIYVESKLGLGTSFFLRFPVIDLTETPNAATSDILDDRGSVSLQNAITRPKMTSIQTEDTENPLILVVEDNTDVAHYLSRILTPSYRILLSKDGQSGIEKAQEAIPDLIITDVMMPGKNGYELCAALKADERTSHIPIIMLTAKAADEDRLTGLRTGADAYLRKPFDPDELFVRMEQLILLRRKMQSHYAQKALPADVALLDNIEDRFLSRVTRLVESELDQNLSIEEMAAQLHLSRVQFFRKVKALTGLSPSRFVQRIRLRHAASLLSHSDLTISEIAYQVGFSDPKYFSKQFATVFGQLPTSYRNEIQTSEG
ncbi:MAG: ATP-binding protein, partial [Bacteroidota bacterium]